MWIWCDVRAGCSPDLSVVAEWCAKVIQSATGIKMWKEPMQAQASMYVSIYLYITITAVASASSGFPKTRALQYDGHYESLVSFGCIMHDTHVLRLSHAES